MVSRQEALFGIEKIAFARMIDIAQHLHLMKKLGQGVWGGAIGCGFFKIFTKHGTKGLSKCWGKRGVYREKFLVGTKKAYRAYHPIGFNFKCQPTNSYLTRTIVQKVAMEYSRLLHSCSQKDQ